MLPSVDLDKYFIDVKGVAVALMLSFQSARINGSELNAPQSDRFTANSDAPLGQDIFNITVAEIESIVEPDSVGDDVRRESVSFICIHSPILSISVSLLVSTLPRPCRATSASTASTTSSTAGAYYPPGMTPFATLLSQHNCPEIFLKFHKGATDGIACKLLIGGGDLEVPCLRIGEGERGFHWMYGARDIIGYLEGQFVVV